MNGTKINGRTNIIIRWLLSAVAAMTRPAPSWVTT